ncbi:MAG: TetR/AcrR family transcriptional regulator [Acidobacteriota bacterium]|nr:TetR/AcrR family transcriptional regulator [Acidobacteriota bacterium]
MTSLTNPKNGVPASRRERAKADKRQRILEASKTLFSSRGFDQTTVQQIADAADVAVGTLFLYVADKSELLLLVFHEAIEAELSSAERHLTGNRGLIPSVGKFFNQLLSLYERDINLSRIYIREFLFHEGRIRTQLDNQTSVMMQALRERVERAQRTGEISGAVDPEIAALHMYSLYHSALSFRLAACVPSDGSLIETLLQSYSFGLHLPEEPPAPRKSGSESTAKRRLRGFDNDAAGKLK